VTTQLANAFILTGLDAVFFAVVGALLATVAVVARLAIGNRPRTFELPLAPPAQIGEEQPEQAVSGLTA
jgi:hypothetical protein